MTRNEAQPCQGVRIGNILYVMVGRRSCFVRFFGSRKPGGLYPVPLAYMLLTLFVLFVLRVVS